MNSITLSLELANRIVGYLSRQPYAEVAVLIADISKAASTAGIPTVDPDAAMKSNGNVELQS